MSFHDFLYQKRIHAEAWQQARREEYGKLEQMFVAMGEVSFDQQKKFLFNPVRLEFPLPAELVPEPIKKARVAPAKLTAKSASASSAPAMKEKLPLKKKAAAASDSPAPKAPPLKGKLPLKKKAVTDDSESPGKTVTKAPPLKGKLPLKKKLPIPTPRQETPPETTPASKAPRLKGNIKLKTKSAPTAPQASASKAPPMKKSIPLKAKKKPEDED